MFLWKPFAPDAASPKWIKRKKLPDIVPGKVTVSAFVNGWCPAQNMIFERAKRAAADFGSKVAFQEYRTADRDIFAEWGISDGLRCLDAIPYVECTLADWIAAGGAAFALRRKGITIPLTDLVIAASPSASTPPYTRVTSILP